MLHLLLALRAIPESVGAEGSFVIAGWDVGSLVPCHHVFKGRLLNHVKADAHAGASFHVVYVVGLQHRVYSQALDVQLQTH